MTKIELGKLLNERREVLGLSIRDLADVSGLSKTTISQIELGLGNPTFEVLQVICDLLNLEIKIEIKQK